MKIILVGLFLLIAAFLVFPQADTANLGDNTWLNILPGTSSLPVNGSNWAYENDFKSHPFYGLFILGPGHIVHPQDRYFMPYDPITNKWYKNNPPLPQPRHCLSSFCISSQDTVILHLANGETGHQLGQGGFGDDYRSIDFTRKRTSRIWTYSFNRNNWSHMRGPIELPPNMVTHLPQYDPIHDVMIATQAGETWVYSYHYNFATKYTNNPVNFAAFFYSTAMDTKRGRFYILGGGSDVMHYLDAGTMTWTRIPGASPATEPVVTDGNGLGLNLMAYDELHDVMIYINDASRSAGFGAPNVKTWVFYCDSLKWAQLTPATSPVDRGKLAYNKALNLFMMVGGEADAFISRGGGTKGLWLYRYKHGGSTVFDSMAAAPTASISTAGGTVSLSWSAVNESGVSGYNIYRASANPFPRTFSKINSSLVTDVNYTDGSAVSGTWYSYRVCAVKNGVEGQLSRHLYTRPGRVLDVVASVEDTMPGKLSAVRVSWKANTETNLTGYNVYRARANAIFDSAVTTPLQNYTKLNAAPVSGTEYWDTLDLSDKVARGYIVTAVSPFGTESGTSPECTTFPNGPENAWSLPTGQTWTLRVKPPHRIRIAGINLYKFDTLARAIKQNTAGLIIDTLTTGWAIPNGAAITVPDLLKQTFFARAVNILGQEGFLTDQFSPINSDFGVGIPPNYQAFDYSKYSPIVSVEGDGQPAGESIPGDSSIAVWPNPFNPSVNVRYVLQKAAQVRLSIFDMNGRLVQRVMRHQAAGRHMEQFNLTPYASGVYMVRLTGPGLQREIRVVLAK